VSPGRWLAAVWIAAAVFPLAVLHRTAVAPATNLVAALPSANPLDDPATNATAIARAWARWERGDALFVDDRVFAPIPNALPCGESFPLSALVGYPFFAWTGSVPAGVNAAYFLAVFAFPVLLYALYARLAGPGLVPAVAAFAVAWGPGRMNTLGVLTGLSTGFAFLAVLAAWDFLRNGRAGRLALFGLALVAMGGFGLYPLALGVFFGVPAVGIAAGRAALHPRRAFLLAATGCAELLVLLVPYGPYRHLAETLGTTPSRLTFEGHAADLLSLLHGGIFGGPVRAALESLVPGFPPGAAAFFPTLAFTFAIAVWTARGRGTLSPVPWLVFAAVLFVCSLGPTIHAAGRPIGPGPYRLLTGLPVLSGLRGIHRFDQWFDVALGAAAVLCLSALAGHRRAAAFRTAFVALALVDLWPADVPATSFPAPSAYAARVRALPRDASVAVYPWNRTTSTQAWIDQLRHGRRVVNGWFTYPPASHEWAERTLRSMPVAGAVAVLREMGASTVVVDRRALAARARADVDALVPGADGITGREEVPGFTLLSLDRREPCFIPAEAEAAPLVFRGRTALAACRPEGLVFRTGAEIRPVVLRAPDGSTSRAGLRAPVAGPPPLPFTLSAEASPGTSVEDARSGRSLGRVEGR
jgi:hypothetical protein